MFTQDIRVDCHKEDRDMEIYVCGLEEEEDDRSATSSPLSEDRSTTSSPLYEDRSTASSPFSDDRSPSSSHVYWSPVPRNGFSIRELLL